MSCSIFILPDSNLVFGVWVGKLIMTTTCLKQEEINSIYTSTKELRKTRRPKCQAGFGMHGIHSGHYRVWQQRNTKDWEEGWLESRFRLLLWWGDLTKQAIFGED